MASLAHTAPWHYRSLARASLLTHSLCASLLRPITGFQWLEDDVVLVSLANGYVTSVDFGAMVRMRRQHGLPEAVKATGTTKVFNEYLTCLTYSPKSKRIACAPTNPTPTPHPMPLTRNLAQGVAPRRTPYLTLPHLAFVNLYLTCPSRSRAWRHGSHHARTPFATARVPSSHRRPRPHCVGPACRCVGDKGVKVITRDGADLEVLVDHTLEYAPLSTSLGDTWHALLTPVALVPRGRYELSIGNCIDSCRWDSDGSHLVITATNGYLWCFEFQTK